MDVTVDRSPNEHAIVTDSVLIEAGFSNSPAVEHAPDDSYPDIEAQEAPKPGWSNVTGGVEDEQPVAETKVTEPKTKTVRRARKRA